MCGAPDQAAELPAGTDLTKESVVVGRVTASGSPVAGAYVRLLDGTGEFTAEVTTSASGDYRFFAAPGAWTLRVLSRAGNGRSDVAVSGPGLYTTGVEIAAS